MKKWIILLAVLLMSIGSADALTKPCSQPGCDDHSGDFTFNDDLKVTGGIDRAAKFIVYGDGTNYTVYDGHTNENAHSGTYAITEIQWAIDNLTSGRTWKEKVVLKGNMTLGSASSGVDSTVDIPDYTIIECVDGKLTAVDDIHSDNITGTEKGLFEGSNNTNGNHFIEINNCIMDGNNFVGGVDESQSANFNAIWFKSISFMSTVTDLNGAPTCTLIASKVDIRSEYTNWKILVDAPTTFKYSVNGGNNYYEDTVHTIASETIADSNPWAGDDNTHSAYINNTNLEVDFTANHNLSDGDTIIFDANGGTFPDAIEASDSSGTYSIVYWVDATDADTITLSESYDAYIDGRFVQYDVTSQAGTQKAWKVQEVDRGVYVAFSATTCDNSTPDGWTFTLQAGFDITVNGNNISHFSSEGIEFRGVGHSRISNNILSTFEDDGISFDACNNLYITGNLVELADSSDIEGTEGSYNIFITDNITRNSRSQSSGSGGSGIHYVVDGATNQKYGYNIIAERNIVYGNGKNGIRFVNNVSGGQPLMRIILKDNVVYDNSKHQTNATALGFTVVKDGIIASNTSYDNGDANNEHGIHVSDSTGIIIEGNMVFANSATGIYCDDCNDSIISNNYTKGNSLAQVATYEIRVDDTGTDCSGNMILNNIINGLTISGTTTLSNGIRIDTGCSNTYVDGNKVIDDRTASFQDNSSSTIWGQNFDVGGAPMINEGVASSLADGGTIAHGLMGTPVFAFCTTTTPDEFCSIALGATNLTVAITKGSDGSAGTTADIYWRAVFKP